MAYRLPNGSTIDVAATYGTPATVAISNANPAVVTSTAHGLDAGAIVLFEALGWTKLNNRAFRIANVTDDTYELENVNSTDTTRYPVGVGVGNAKVVATWLQIPQVLTVDYSGGEQQFYTFKFLEDDDERQLPTNKSASSLTINVADDPDQPFVALLEEYDESREIHVFRLNLVNGDSIVYPAVPSITATPTLTVNSLMERVITLAMQGRISRYSKIV
jgi:hypothetical protein